jgi:hypothetical protein
MCFICAAAHFSKISNLNPQSPWGAVGFISAECEHFENAPQKKNLHANSLGDMVKYRQAVAPSS